VRWLRVGHLRMANAANVSPICFSSLRLSISITLLPIVQTMDSTVIMSPGVNDCGND
jgi:hypothetical protein